MNVLWSSNSPWSTSGYGTQTRMFLPKIRDLGHNVAVNCFYGLEGAAIPWFEHPDIGCYPTDNTRFGNILLPEYARHHGQGDAQNCLVMTLMDVWVMIPALDRMRDLRFACWTPIDHDPCPPMVTRFLKETDAQVIAMSRFGQRMLEAEGFDSLYVPHAVDTSVFRPLPDRRAEIRAGLKLPGDAFVVGMVANNQGLPSRKSFPQVFDAFARFQKKHKDAFLYVHADVMGMNNGINLVELARICGIDGDRIRTTDQLNLHLGVPAETMAAIFNSFDVLCMPSLGEGFGIPLVEAQACGVPVVTTDWTAMTELCGAGWLVDGERFYDATQGSFFKTPRVGEIVDALEAAYKHADGLKVRAAEFAAGYDVDRVWDEFWLPVMDRVTAPREIAPLRLAA